MMVVEPAQNVYRTWIVDSERWLHYRPRRDDIIVATYPKCGTTWMQRIVGLLVFQTPDPKPIMDISPWVDRRFPQPVEDVVARLEAQKHRRFIKTHLPFDGLPIFADVKYIHVARDGREACYSFHNHATGFQRSFLEALDTIGVEDETIARPYPRIPADPAEYFHNWLTQGAVPDHHDGEPSVSFFHFERSWWRERHRPNVLLVHYRDLKSDLQVQMRRVAEFLGIEIPHDVFPELVEAAGFDAMRRDGDQLMGSAAKVFLGGGARFFNKGVLEGWRGIFEDEDLALYDGKISNLLPPECQSWLAQGRSEVPE